MRCLPFLWLSILWAITFAFPTTALGQGKPAESPPASVVLEQVLRETVAPKQEFVGTARPSRRTIVGTAVDGRVEIYDIDAGQRVEQRDLLAGLKQGTIQIEIDGAVAEADLRQAELSELENGARPEEIARAEAQLAAAKALESYTASKQQRTRELASTGGAISSQELELAISDYQNALQRRIEAEQSLNLLREGPRAEQIAQANARLKAQQERVRLLEDRKTKYKIIAPFGGYIVREYTEAGAWVKQGDPIAEIVDLDTVEVEVQVPESSIAYLRPGMQIPVRLDAFEEEAFEGALSQVIPDANTTTRTFPVKIRVPNRVTDGLPMIRAGMLSRALLPTGAERKELTVHKDAVVFGGPSPIVYISDNGVAKPVPVEIIVESGERTAVRGQLQEGQSVVVLGNERLRPGQKLNPLPPADAGLSTTTEAAASTATAASR